MPPRHLSLQGKKDTPKGRPTHVLLKAACVVQRPHSVTAAERVNNPAGEKNKTRRVFSRKRPAYSYANRYRPATHRPALTAITAVARPQSSPIVPRMLPLRKEPARPTRDPQGEYYALSGFPPNQSQRPTPIYQALELAGGLPSRQPPTHSVSTSHRQKKRQHAKFSPPKPALQ